MAKKKFFTKDDSDILMVFIALTVLVLILMIMPAENRTTLTDAEDQQEAPRMEFKLYVIPDNSSEDEQPTETPESSINN